jgi:soluble lytic murein transglycosylase-like protein
MAFADWRSKTRVWASLAITGLVGAIQTTSFARADVLEIGPQGSVTVYSAPALFTAQGAAPIRAAPSLKPAPAASEQVSRLIAEASTRFAISPTLIRAVAWRESRFQQSAISRKGAIGVMQLTAGTARQLGVDPYDLRQNIHGGAAYMSQLLTRYRGDTGLALAAYNAGPGVVDRYGGAPPYSETRRYVSDILGVALAGYDRASPLILGQ